MENQKKLFTSAEKCWNQWKRDQSLLPLTLITFFHWFQHFPALLNNFFDSSYQKIPPKPLRGAVTRCDITDTIDVPHATCRWHNIQSGNEKSYKESRVPELLNKTVASKKNLRFCETTENVDFVAEIVIAEGEIEGFRYKIDGYQDKINRLRQLERHSGPYYSSKTAKILWIRIPDRNELNWSTAGPIK